MPGGVRITGGIAILGTRVGGPPSPAGSTLNGLGDSVYFSRDDFAKLIGDHGYDVTWERAAMCPNVHGASPKDHSITCTFCQGSKFIYYASTETRMLIVGVKLTENFYSYGRWDTGDSMVTALPEQRLSYFDRLTLHKALARFQELVFRGVEGNSDQVKYSIIDVEYVTWATDDRTALRTAVKDTDFTVSGNTVTWNSTNRPPAGKPYSMSYTFHPTMVVQNLIHQHRDQVAIDANTYEFPTQAVARMEFITRDQGRDAAPPEDPDPFFRPR